MINYDKEQETVCIEFPINLQLGEGSLSVKYTGELNDKMKGFYRAKYTTPEGEERYCATTQFEVSRKFFENFGKNFTKMIAGCVQLTSKSSVRLFHETFRRWIDHSTIIFCSHLGSRCKTSISLLG